MGLPNVPYAAQTSPQMVELDQTFAAVAALGTIPCTAVGTNTITLTPLTNAPAIPTYANYLRFGFVAQNTLTGVAQMLVTGLPTLNLYDAGGVTQATTGDVIAGQYYEVVYQLTLNSGAGGFVIVSAIIPHATSGLIAQVVNFQTGAVATGTTIIPLDDTIPQNTEGNQYMSLAITPTNASSKLIIEVVWVGSNSASCQMGLALFQDATVGALAATAAVINTGTNMVTIPLTFEMTAGTTSTTTFEVRAGQNGGAGTTTFNGQSGGRIFGGVMASSITITEVLPP